VDLQLQLPLNGVCRLVEYRASRDATPDRQGFGHQQLASMTLSAPDPRGGRDAGRAAQCGQN